MQKKNGTSCVIIVIVFFRAKVFPCSRFFRAFSSFVR